MIHKFTFNIFFYVDFIFNLQRCRRSFHFTNVDYQIGLLFGLVFAIENFTDYFLYMKKSCDFIHVDFPFNLHFKNSFLIDQNSPMI